jgi:hypothetical protein
VDILLLHDVSFATIFAFRNRLDRLWFIHGVQVDVITLKLRPKIPYMAYRKRIEELARMVPKVLVDFDRPRDPVRIPTQASSNFITNKEQGDWAEGLVMRAINETATNYVAVKYGKSDDIVAGDLGFETFFKEFQGEMDAIGKRPDLLIFRIEDFDPALGQDISRQPAGVLLDYVKKAIAGIEVRSSSFLIDRYDTETNVRIERATKKAFEIRDEILEKYSDLLTTHNKSAYLAFLNQLSETTLGVVDFRVPSWSANSRLLALSELFRSLKSELKELQKRDYLSITPKVEDLIVVKKWIDTFEVPHFYFQVFFDKVYGISFERILEIIGDAENEGKNFGVERDSKNQNKSTIKINSKSGLVIAGKVLEPTHTSVRKEMGRGRLLFYVTFDGGTAVLDIGHLCQILSIQKEAW